MLRSLVIVVGVLLALPSLAGGKGETKIQPLRLGFSPYVGWHSLQDLPHTPTLARDLKAVGRVLVAAPFPDQDRANAAYLEGDIQLLAISNVDLLHLMAADRRFPPSVAMFLTDVSLGADTILGLKAERATGPRRQIALVQDLPVSS